MRGVGEVGRSSGVGNDDAVCDASMCRTRCGEVSSQRYLQTEACAVAVQQIGCSHLKELNGEKGKNTKKRGTPFPHADRRRVDLSERGSRECVYSAWPSLPNFKFSRIALGWGGSSSFAQPNALNSSASSGRSFGVFESREYCFPQGRDAMINRNCNDGLDRARGNDREKPITEGLYGNACVVIDLRVALYTDRVGGARKQDGLRCGSVNNAVKEVEMVMVVGKYGRKVNERPGQ